MVMDFYTYKILHSETIMYYQILENDLKLIYSKMIGGDFDENLDKILDYGLGQIIEALQNADSEFLFSDSDYDSLKEIKDNRNYWAHENFLMFMYKGYNFQNTDEYKESCSELKKDHDEIEEDYKIVEQIKINYLKD